MTEWPLVPLREVLVPINRPEVVIANERYRLLGAHWYAEGLYIKDTKAGSEIQAAKLFRVETGDFVYNRLFAWKGAFALAGDDVDGCYVSNEFPCFRVQQTRLDGRYLHYYFSRETVWNEVLGHSTGGTPTSRNRLKEEHLLSLTVPLPPIEEQKRISERLEDVAKQIHEANGIHSEMNTQADTMLMSAYWRIAADSPRRALGEIAPLTRRPVVVDTEKVYPQVAVRSFGRGSFHREPLVGADVTWEKPFLVKAGDILISNIKAWEGAIAVATSADDSFVASHRYLTCVPITEIATARFVCFHLLTPEGLRAVGEASPGSADRNRTLGAKALLRIPVPLPSYAQQLWFDEQCRRIDAINDLRKKAGAALEAVIPAMLAKVFDHAEH